MVLTPPMVFAQTDGIVSVLLDHTRTRGPSVARMRDFLNVSSLTLMVWEDSVLKMFSQHLCFEITEKWQMIVPDLYNRILDYKRKYGKSNVFQ